MSQAQLIPLTGDALKLNELRIENNLKTMNESANSGNSDSTSSESDDTGSDTSSSTDSADSEGSRTLEQAEITDEVLQLPRDLCEYEYIFREFFTEDLWKQLEPAQRMRLQSKLPDFSKLLEPAEAMAEQQYSVQLLFRNRLQRFGRNPLLELHRNLQTGNYRPDIKVLRRSITKSQRREQRFRECERIGHLSKKLFIARERFLRKAYNSAPDEIPNFEKTMQRQQNQHSFLLNADTKICAVRARKRFYAEIADYKKQIVQGAPKPIGTLSADEDEKDEDTLMHLAEDLHVEEMTALKSAATFASTTDKCIYDTFFQRRNDFTDEEAMRLSQYAKRPKLTNRNFKQYLTDYKRKKLTEPNLPEYETGDIRLRDVCARAQIGGSFKRSFPLGQKPGRKPKAKISEPPALVPINQTEILAHQNLLKQQKIEQNANVTVQSAAIRSKIISKNANNLYQPQHFDVDGVELQQEEVETSLPVTEIDVGNGKGTAKIETLRALPKLEPIIQQRTLTIKKSPIKAVPPNTSQANSAINVVIGSGAIIASSSSNELIQETHSCYFALIRDFFCSTPNHRMKFEELKQRIQIWLNNPITALNDWYALANNWSSLLASAVKFLAGDYVEQPLEYVPFIEYKSQLNIYQWIGAGRDSDTRLTPICNFWLEHRKELHLAKPALSPLQIQQQTKTFNDTNQTNISAGESAPPLGNANISSIVNLTPPPPPRCVTKWTVRAATLDEVAEFRRQERERFDQPHRAYTYRMHGYESIVGPVRGIYSQGLALTKARGHSMMVDDRPNFVTILTLVRDATARLPNGEGTRADISELLKCSQYINPNVAENVMQSIVSGALDRLHTETDACVRYDAKRKIWIYMHRNRSEIEFERLHQKQQNQPKTNKVIKMVTATTPTTPTPIVDSPATAAVSNSTRKMLPKAVTVSRSLPTKDNISGSILTMPALVPAAATTNASSNKIIQPVLPKTVLPVPPLKYNIPATVLQQHQHQKSLLKTTIHQQQHRRFIDAKTGATLLTTGVSSINAAGKPIGYSIPAGRLISVTTDNTSTTPSTATTTATSTATTISPASKNTTPLTATVAGKRVALTKPIIINQLNNKIKTQQQQQKSQTTQGYIIPITASNSNIQMQLQPQFVQVNASSASNVKPIGNIQTIVVEPHTINKVTSNETIKQPASKNIIRFVQNIKQPQQQQIIANNKLIGQRLITSPIGSNSKSNNFTIRGATKILTTSLNSPPTKTTANNSIQEVKNATTVVSTSPVAGNGGLTAANLPGTIIKMTPQAFTALQQKQNIAKTQQQTQQQQQPTPQRQQRLIIGNTAIIAHGSGGNILAKNVLLPQQQQQQQQQTDKLSATPPLTKMTVKNTIKPIDMAVSTSSATSITPQQQRILIQNLKQQQQQQQQPNQTNKPLTVVVPHSSAGSGVTRLLKTAMSAAATPLSSTAATTTTTRGKTITIGGKTTTGQILTLNTTAMPNEIGSKIVTPATPRNIIAIGSGTTQQRLIATTPTNAANKAAGGSNIRVIRSVSNEANTSGGPTTFSIANIQGKQVVFATKATAANIKQVAGTNIVSGQNTATANSILIGGQTIKLQGNNSQVNLVKNTGNATITTSANLPTITTTQQSPQLQTVIMGNQILRVLPQNLISAKTVARSDGTTVNAVPNRIITVSANAGNHTTSTAPPTANATNAAAKTFVLNSGTQTIRFPSTSAANASQDLNQTALQKTSANGNRVVLAVPGGGQILLPTGGTLNLKSLQNMKLVSLAQVQQQQQQQQQEKTKNNLATATTLAKT